jgi:nucleoside diphosphate kinase
VLGPTDPKAAPEGALRGTILKDWVALGLAYEPNTGDNCVHASASPFEGLAERMNWLKADPATVSGECVLAVAAAVAAT